MAAARGISKRALVQGLQQVMDHYGSITNPEVQVEDESTTACIMNFFHIHGKKGRDRLLTLQARINDLNAMNADVNTLLKSITQFAMDEYNASWLKSSDGLSASLLNYIGQVSGMEREDIPQVHVAPYGSPGAYHYFKPESDGMYFARVSTAVNPPVVVAKSNPNDYEYNVYAGAGRGAPLIHRTHKDNQVAAPAVAPVRNASQTSDVSSGDAARVARFGIPALSAPKVERCHSGTEMVRAGIPYVSL